MKLVDSKLFIFITIIILTFSSCLPFNAFVYMIPDQKDIRRFKNKEVKHADTTFEFIKTDKNKDIFVTNWNYKLPLSRTSLEHFLEDHKAQYFLVIKNDSIVFNYSDKKIKTYNPSPVFSISKTLLSAAVGKAIQQGYIGSINDLVTNYIPELNYNDNFKTLTINHLLNQRSGIKENVNHITNANYGKIEKILGKGKIEFSSKPGEKLEYINTNSTLLGILIERATKIELVEYFSTNIWSQIGTADSTVWGFDYKTNHTRAMSCFGGSIYDLAKFGKLYLDKGKWNNKQILDSNWVINSTNPINSLQNKDGYNNSWYIGEEQIGDYMTVGMYRQQIYINPKSNVIIVSLLKFHSDNLKVRWWQIMRQISEQVE